jgi:hypothetical protein
MLYVKNIQHLNFLQNEDVYHVYLYKSNYIEIEDEINSITLKENKFKQIETTSSGLLLIRGKIKSVLNIE